MMETTVWIFSGSRTNGTSTFPSGVFSTQARAEEWIQRHKLSGTLTLYRLDIGAYDWAVQNDFFQPSKPHHTTPEFIGQFTGGDVHFHYDHGHTTGGKT